MRALSINSLMRVLTALNTANELRTSATAPLRRRASGDIAENAYQVHAAAEAALFRNDAYRQILPKQPFGGFTTQALQFRHGTPADMLPEKTVQMHSADRNLTEQALNCQSERGLHMHQAKRTEVLPSEASRQLNHSRLRRQHRPAYRHSRR